MTRRAGTQQQTGKQLRKHLLTDASAPERHSSQPNVTTKLLRLTTQWPAQSDALVHQHVAHSGNVPVKQYSSGQRVVLCLVSHLPTTTVQHRCCTEQSTTSSHVPTTSSHVPTINNIVPGCRRLGGNPSNLGTCHCGAHAHDAVGAATVVAHLMYAQVRWRCCAQKCRGGASFRVRLQLFRAYFLLPHCLQTVPHECT